MIVVYTAYNTEIFYLRHKISQFEIQEGNCPLNPFMNFDYSLGFSEAEDIAKVNAADSKLVEICGEVHVFGKVGDSGNAMLNLVRKLSKPIRFFLLINTEMIFAK